MNKISSLRGSNADEAIQNLSLQLWIASLTLAMTILVMILPSLALAAEPSTYSPETCNFAITFPDKPYISRRCDDDDQSRCYDMVSYTQVYPISATVNFRVICNPVGEDIYKQYSGEVMEATVKAMTKRSVVQTFESSFREETHYKQAGLVGEGKVGLTPTIYIAQLWISHSSILSVEAELIGQPHDEADQLFSSVLKSVRFVEEEENQENESKEKPEEKKEKKEIKPSQTPNP